MDVVSLKFLSCFATCHCEHKSSLGRMERNLCPILRFTEEILYRSITTLQTESILVGKFDFASILFLSLAVR